MVEATKTYLVEKRCREVFLEAVVSGDEEKIKYLISTGDVIMLGAEAETDLCGNIFSAIIKKTI